MSSSCLARGIEWSNVYRIDRNALDPGILHYTSDLQGRVVRNQRTHQVQARIQTGRDTARGDDAHTTERHLGTTGDGLATARLLPGIASLACNGFPPTILCVLVPATTGLPDDVGIVVRAAGG